MIDIKKRVSEYSGHTLIEVGRIPFIQALLLHYLGAVDSRKDYLLKASVQSHKKEDQLKYKNKYNSFILFLRSINDTLTPELSEEEAKKETLKQMAEHSKVLGGIFSG